MILSLDTSTTVCSVALTSGQQLVAEQEYHLDRSHSTLLPVIIQDILKFAGIKGEDLVAIALSDGPGSYTGLRIGASTAKGLCFAWDKPLIAVSTLQAMAHGVAGFASEDNLLCPMLDARRMEVYTALYTPELIEVMPVQAIPLQEDSFQTYHDRELIFFGNGAEKTRTLFQDARNISYWENITLRASSVGKLAADKLEKKQLEDIAYYEPFYLKEFKAIKAKPLI